MWIRICYDTENEEAHAALWDKYVEISQVVGPQALVLDDKELFENADIVRILELFPERVTNYCAPDDVRWREKELGDSLTIRREAGNAPESAGEMSLSSEELCKRYWKYHTACVVSHFFIEDAEAQRGGGVLHVFLDDCGNVVKQITEDSRTADNFDGAWFEGRWKDGWCSNPGAGELGAAYLPGGVRGPPYE